MDTLQFLFRLLLGSRLSALEWLGRKETGRFRIGNRRGILLNTPELIEEVLVHRAEEFQKGPALRIYSRPLLGDGLLTAEGEQHRKQRKLVAPAFAHNRVPRYAGVMAELSRKVCQSWPDASVVAMQREMTRLTLWIVGRTLFDVDLLEDADEIGKHITELIHYATDQTRSLRPAKPGHEGQRGLKAQVAIDALNATMFRLIRDRRELAEDKGDLLSMLLLSRDDDGNALTDQQVRDEAMTLFVAGHETTANATTWALYLLACHPEVQSALQKQVQDAIGNDPLTYADLPRIPLALQVFKEALRLFPPAYIMVREPLDDLVLNNGIRVRKGELVAMCEWAVHRNERYFPNAKRFDPDRFAPANESGIPRYGYFPFGAGRRICIGNQFALMEGQIILATVMQQAAVSLVSRRPLKGDPLMTLRPHGDVNLRIARYALTADAEAVPAMRSAGR